MAKHEESMYGFFPGGDPRDFSPVGDDDSTETERANHRLACEAWDKAQAMGLPPPKSEADCIHIGAPGLEVILTRAQYGLGVYTIEWDCIEESDGEAACWECHPELIPPLEE